MHYQFNGLVTVVDVLPQQVGLVAVARIIQVIPKDLLLNQVVQLVDMVTLVVMAYIQEVIEEVVVAEPLQQVLLGVLE
jgi:hypothetical protein